ncbi:MAG TPA: hypothetical protein VGL86_24655 [Polyangia bacterium]
MHAHRRQIGAEPRLHLRAHAAAERSAAALGDRRRRRFAVALAHDREPIAQVRRRVLSLGAHCVHARGAEQAALARRDLRIVELRRRLVRPALPWSLRSSGVAQAPLRPRIIGDFPGKLRASRTCVVHTPRSSGRSAPSLWVTRPGKTQ